MDGMMSPEEWKHHLGLLAQAPERALYRNEIKWTDFDGTRHSISSGWRFHMRVARKESLRRAIGFGWTRPRWWQWWRWDDTRPDLDFRK